MTFPPELWLIILEYVAEHEHGKDAWLWHSRLICRQVDYLARSLIWKQLKVTFNMKPAAPRYPSQTLYQVVAKAIEPCWSMFIHVFDFLEGDATDNHELHERNSIMSSIVTQGTLATADHVLGSLERMVRTSSFDGRFNARNHIALAKAELRCYGWYKNRLSEFTRALFSYRDPTMLIEEYTQLITACLAQEFLGHTLPGYYANDISSRNVTHMVDQVWKNRNYIQKLEVVADGASENLERIRVAYVQLARALYDCSSLQVLLLRNEFPFDVPVEIASIHRENARPGLSIIARPERGTSRCSSLEGIQCCILILPHFPTNC
ncbi:hypothetical protein TRVA0_027S00254 [Trichomonascus vanleenenianus]|uniref:uncharacterized protein n=1 Tax=Trichomonascus vanleenenianus TaxID=2268995 RepID=UPI003EC9EDDF